MHSAGGMRSGKGRHDAIPYRLLRMPRCFRRRSFRPIALGQAVHGAAGRDRSFPHRF